MTSRQRMLRRSGAVEPRRGVGRSRAPARTPGGTATAAVVTLSNGDVEGDDFEPSPGDPFDRGRDAGAESSAAQLQEAPCEHCPWQQQAPGTLFPQQLPGCVERRADLLQHDGSVRAPRSQCGHAGAGVAAEQPTSPSVSHREGLSQLQTVSGKASTGTSTAASQTIDRAAILLWNCTARLHARGV